MFPTIQYPRHPTCASPGYALASDYSGSSGGSSSTTSTGPDADDIVSSTGLLAPSCAAAGASRFSRDISGGLGLSLPNPATGVSGVRTPPAAATGQAGARPRTLPLENDHVSPEIVSREKATHALFDIYLVHPCYVPPLRLREYLNEQARIRAKLSHDDVLVLLSAPTHVQIICPITYITQFTDLRLYVFVDRIGTYFMDWSTRYDGCEIVNAGIWVDEFGWLSC